MTTLTLNFYTALNTAVEHFNQTLFDGKLPECMIILQRSKKTAGYFAERRWVGKDNNKEHEIALNPTLITKFNLMELLQTIVHEQCHLHQHVHGTAGRSNYHNKHFANLMESIGLMTSSTGREGGKRTGQKMGDYPIFNGRFNHACIDLVKNGFELPLYDLLVDGEPVVINDVAQLTANDDPIIVSALLSPVADFIDGLEALEPIKSPTKTKYHCTGCGGNLWGKAGFDILCKPCGVTMTVV